MTTPNVNFPGWQVQELPNLEQEPAEGGGGGGGGISPPAGDIGGTTAAPTVVSTHLTNPLPVAQGGLGAAVTTLTDAATIAVNAALGSFFRVTLGGNRTLGTPTNPADGQRITFEIVQDATGSRTLAYSGAYAFPASIPSPTLSSTAAQRDFLSFVYDAGVSLWQCTGWVPDQNAGIVPVAQGGTGQSTAAAGYNALSPMTTTGDLEYESARLRLPGWPGTLPRRSST